ncbi:YtxH domain-containing protein [Palleniella muris]|jgi:Gas vesicle protein|uniref:YtxH domain-containing protein n=1 Tax=Palleniella muris TaxID=3038145 RepID=A0AC61QLH7_9BACT|nr:MULTISPECIES: YtxH domain-containing protein [Palleniella]NPD80610.1 YtxH domain-containing protein [Palleniella intestinalis]TGX79635.1 YtxH domain-containing protein [Palleniella muris]
MKTLGYIGAFLGGAIAGAAIGLLAAPESGKDTRKKISSTIKDFCDKHNLELSKKEMAELAEDLVDINAE